MDRNRRGSAALVIIIAIIVLLVCAGVWYFVSYRRTLGAMKDIVGLGANNPALTTVPAFRILAPATPATSTSFSIDGLEFSVPWAGVSSTQGTGPSAVVFRSGNSFALLDFGQDLNEKVAQFNSESSTIKTGYDLMDAYLHAAPDQVGFFTPPDQAVLSAQLLAMKNLNAPPALYGFDTGVIKGFESATTTKGMVINFFDKADDHYILVVSGTQGEVDYILSSMAVATSTWQKIAIPAFGFTAEFPDVPQRDVADRAEPISGGTATANQYIAYDATGTAYVVGIVAYPTSTTFSNPKTSLQNALAALVSGTTGSALVSSSISSFNGNTSIDYLIRDDAKIKGVAVFLQGRLILEGHDMYQQEVIYKEQNYDGDSYGKFIDSLSIQTN